MRLTVELELDVTLECRIVRLNRGTCHESLDITSTGAYLTDKTGGKLDISRYLTEKQWEILEAEAAQDFEAVKERG